MDPKFTFTERARPICEIGIGSANQPTGSLWDQAEWDDAETAVWGGVEPTWFDVSCHIEEIDAALGRGRLTDAFPAGTAEILANNETGWADLVEDDTPGVLTMRPGRPIRFGVAHTEFGVRWLYRGFIDSIEPIWDAEEVAHVRISCIDALGEVGRVRFGSTAVVGEGETASSRVTRILAMARWPSAKRRVDPSSVELVGFTFEEPAFDMLVRCAESSGGAVFGDPHGNVVFRGRDWLQWPLDAPPDATIGNGSESTMSAGFLSFAGDEPVAVGTLTDAEGTVGDHVVVEARIRSATMTPGSNRLICGQTGYGGWQVTLTATGQLQWLWWPTDAGYRWEPSTLSLTDAATSPDGWLTVRVEFDAPTGHLEFAVSADGVSWQEAGVVEVGPTTIEPGDGSFWIGSLAGLGGQFPGDIAAVTVTVDDVVVVQVVGDVDLTSSSQTTIDPTVGPELDVSDVAGVVNPSVVTTVHDVCPSVWSRPFMRTDLTTRVIVDRMMPADAVAIPNPLVFDDTPGVRKYGTETWERLDLWTRDTNDLARVALRVLAQRNAASLPIVQAVTISAERADPESTDRAVDLLTSLSIWKPSRFRCRHRKDEASPWLFDDQYLACGVSWRITPDEWTADISLDKAAPTAIYPDTPRWDVAEWDVDEFTY